MKEQQIEIGKRERESQRDNNDYSMYGMYKYLDELLWYMIHKDCTELTQLYMVIGVSTFRCII